MMLRVGQQIEVGMLCVPNFFYLLWAHASYRLSTDVIWTSGALGGTTNSILEG